MWIERNEKVKTEKEKMVNGDFYNPADPELIKDRSNARKLTRIFNESIETEDNILSVLLKTIIWFHRN